VGTVCRLPYRPGHDIKRHPLCRIVSFHLILLYFYLLYFYFLYFYFPLSLFGSASTALQAWCLAGAVFRVLRSELLRDSHPSNTSHSSFDILDRSLSYRTCKHQVSNCLACAMFRVLCSELLRRQSTNNISSHLSTQKFTHARRVVVFG
jgi:hypothetical protein